MRELETHLARDGVARAEFEELRYLFDGLAGVPQPFPPEGLVAAVMAGVPEQTARRERSHQLFEAVGCI